MRPPDYLMSCLVEPKAAADAERLAVAVEALAAKDTGLFIAPGKRRGEWRLHGRDEAQLDLAIEALRHLHGVDAAVSAPQVAYRERFLRRHEVDYTHKRLKNGAGQFARVRIVFEPGPPEQSNVFANAAKAESVPARFIAGVERGVESALESGVIAGFPVEGLTATLVDGAFHERDSSVLAFEVAARCATREALAKGSELFEPVMRVDVTAPEEHAGFVIGDLRSRRGEIVSRESADGVTKISGEAPLANLFGYVRQLRSGTLGQADYVLAYSHYAPVPRGPEPPDRFRPAVGMRIVPVRPLDL